MDQEMLDAQGAAVSNQNQQQNDPNANSQQQPQQPISFPPPTSINNSANTTPHSAGTPALNPTEVIIDAEQRKGVQAIRNFLKSKTSYDVLPVSFRLVVLDTSLLVKKSLTILLQNGIVSAPLWNSKTSRFAGLLTATDYINVIQYYFQNPDKMDKIEDLTLNGLREVEKAIGAVPIETISIYPFKSLYEACVKMTQSKARRIPLIDVDEDTGREVVVSVLTQYRILKFLALNCKETRNLMKPLRNLGIASTENIEKVTMMTPVIQVIHLLVKRGVSSIPIIDEHDKFVNIYEAVDVLSLIKGGIYTDLSLSVGEALMRRSDDFEGVYTCTFDDRLDTIMDTIRRARLHRLFVVDDQGRLQGVTIKKEALSDDEVFKNDEASGYDSDQLSECNISGSFSVPDNDFSQFFISNSKVLEEEDVENEDYSGQSIDKLDTSFSQDDKDENEDEESTMSDKSGSILYRQGKVFNRVLQEDKLKVLSNFYSLNTATNFNTKKSLDGSKGKNSFKRLKPEEWTAESSLGTIGNKNKSSSESTENAIESSFPSIFSGFHTSKNKEKIADLMKSLDQLPVYPDNEFYSSYLQENSSANAPDPTSSSSLNNLDDTNDVPTTGKLPEIYSKKLSEIKKFLEEQKEYITSVERSTSLSHNSKKRKKSGAEKFQNMNIEQWEEYGEKLTENASKLVLKIMAFRRKKANIIRNLDDIIDWKANMLMKQELDLKKSVTMFGAKASAMISELEGISGNSISVSKPTLETASDTISSANENIQTSKNGTSDDRDEVTKSNSERSNVLQDDSFNGKKRDTSELHSSIESKQK